MHHARTWLFDLDDTLHNASAGIFQQIHLSMTAYLMRHLQVDEPTAERLRVGYWRRYGATLTGLMRHHGTNPLHFLRETHALDDLRGRIVFDPAVPVMLQRLQGRKIVFSNGPAHYVEAVVDAMGIGRDIDAMFAVEHMHFEPKPSIKAFRHLMQRHRLQAGACVMVEDSPSNLRTAKRLGMQTVLVGRDCKRPGHVDLRLSSVRDLLRAADRLRSRG